MYVCAHSHAHHSTAPAHHLPIHHPPPPQVPTSPTPGPPPLTWLRSSGSTLSWLARDSSTKANSPPWDMRKPVRMLSFL